jgi:hypothetical protein
MLRGTINGLRWEAPAICAYEFSGDKIQYHRVYYNRLVVAKQAAKGWIPKKVVNSVVKIVWGDVKKRFEPSPAPWTSN